MYYILYIIHTVSYIIYIYIYIYLPQDKCVDGKHSLTLHKWSLCGVFLHHCLLLGNWICMSNFDQNAYTWKLLPRLVMMHEHSHLLQSIDGNN